MNRTMVWRDGVSESFMQAREIVINGKFLSAQPTGVHRVAFELIKSLDKLSGKAPEAAGGMRFNLVMPPDAQPSVPLQNIPYKKSGHLVWQFWEQFELPLLSRGKLLVNLCNLAPLARTGDVTMIHDAQVFISPFSYSWPFRSWYQFALPKIGRTSRRILTVSEFSRQKLVEYGIAAPSKIDVIHNGVDHILRIPVSRGIVDRLGLAGRPFVLALANTQRHKNIAVLLKAFALPCLVDVTLVLVGSQGPKNFATAGLHLPANARFSGRITDGEMRALMEEAVCLAFPSLTEGFGLPPLEAMAIGCPAVVAPCGALPETCGDAAVYADPQDAEAWAGAILRFVEDQAARATASAQGRSQAARFTWEKSGRRLRDILGTVISEPVC